MKDFREQILNECRRITENAMWNAPRPQSIEDIVTSDEREAIAQIYFQAAEQALEYIASASDSHSCSPELVLRAVHYLGNHAIPPMGAKTAWFREGLLLLVQIACPYAASAKGGEPFFNDLRHGMDLADQWSLED